MVGYDSRQIQPNVVRDMGGIITMRGQQLQYKQNQELYDNKARFMDMFDAAQSIQHLDYDGQTQALTERIAAGTAAGKDMTETQNYQNADPETRQKMITGLTTMGEQKGYLEPQKAVVHPTYKPAYDTETQSDVFASNEQIGSGAGRFTPRPQQAAVKVYPPGYQEHLPEIPIYKHRTFNVSGIDRDLGMPEQMTDQQQVNLKKETIKTWAKDSPKREKMFRTAQVAQKAYQRIIDKQIEYSQKTGPGTGPWATYGGIKSYVSQDLELLKSLYSDLTFKKTVEIASEAGARSIDSDAEKKALKATVGGITNDDKTNLQLILGGQSIAMRVQRDLAEKNKYFSHYTTMDGFKGGAYKDIAMYDPKMPYGSPPTFVSPGNVVQAKKEGMMGIDNYIDDLMVSKVEPRRMRVDPATDPKNPANW